VVGHGEVQEGIPATRCLSRPQVLVVAANGATQFAVPSASGMRTAHVPAVAGEHWNRWTDAATDPTVIDDRRRESGSALRSKAAMSVHFEFVCVW
jgi:hypothetical protein